MKAPTCCKQPMDQWNSSYNNEIQRVWHCDKCVRERPLDYRPWWRPWTRLDFSQIEDRKFQPPWWMGAVASDPERYIRNELLFVVMPFNIFIDWGRRTYWWMRVRKPNEFEQRLNAVLLRGQTIGAAVERQRWIGMSDLQMQDERGPRYEKRIVTLR